MSDVFSSICSLGKKKDKNSVGNSITVVGVKKALLLGLLSNPDLEDLDPGDSTLPSSNASDQCDKLQSDTSDISEAKSEIFTISSSPDKFSSSINQSSSVSPSSPYHPNSKSSSYQTASTSSKVKANKNVTYAAKPIATKFQKQRQRRMSVSRGTSPIHTISSNNNRAHTVSVSSHSSNISSISSIIPPTQYQLPSSQYHQRLPSPSPTPYYETRARLLRQDNITISSDTSATWSDSSNVSVKSLTSSLSSSSLSQDSLSSEVNIKSKIGKCIVTHL